MCTDTGPVLYNMAADCIAVSLIAELIAAHSHKVYRKSSKLAIADIYRHRCKPVHLL